MNPILQREIEVAFSKHTQPVWFRAAKWIVILGGMYFLRETGYMYWFLGIIFINGIAVHLLWRYKTEGWTRSWYGWNYELNKPKKGDQ